MVDVDLIFVLEGIFSSHGKGLHEANQGKGGGLDKDGGGGVGGEGGTESQPRGCPDLERLGEREGREKRRARCEMVRDKA